MLLGTTADQPIDGEVCALRVLAGKNAANHSLMKEGLCEQQSQLCRKVDRNKGTGTDSQSAQLEGYLLHVRKRFRIQKGGRDRFNEDTVGVLACVMLQVPEGIDFFTRLHE